MRPWWQAKWWPTDKWWVGRVTQLGGLLTMWATTSGWGQEETVAAIALAVSAVTTWITRNDPPPPEPAP